MSIFGEIESRNIEVTPPGASKSVYLAPPPTSEWISLVREVQALEGKTPDASLVARVVATCMVDENGKRLKSDALRKELVETTPHVVMWLYKHCWKTVLKVGDETIKDAEGNSEASQGS
jgi:hypothetical protein